MPSGMLWRVTAVIKSVVRFQELDIPSGDAASGCRCGRMPSHQHQEHDPQNHSAGRGDPADSPAGLGLLNGGDQKAPDRSGDHDPRRKAQKYPLKGHIDPFMK